MTPLWTSADAARTTGGRNSTDWQATGVSIDTRTLEPGDLFVALKDIRDGHGFVATALNKGAAAALVSRIPDGVPDDAPLLVVDDVLASLSALARAARNRTNARVVAVTGSVGKTSTKEMLRTILEPQGRTHAAADSYNNHWGVPLTLARMPANTEFAVIEIGMNHPGEIAPLAKMTRPHIALITNVAAVHMEAFDDLAGIAREKAALFEGIEPDGCAVINSDGAELSILVDALTKRQINMIGFGEKAGAQFHLEQAHTTGDSTTVKATANGQPLLFKLGCPGSHFAINALGALAAAKALGVDLAIAAIDLEKWALPPGRGARETIVLDVVDDHLTLTLIDDAFNASPISMAAALTVLAASQSEKPGRKVAILGDMLELGPNEITLHTEIADLPALAQIDIIHCVGPRMAELHAQLPAAQQGIWNESANEMAAQVHNLIQPGDIILVKGSKGSYVSQVVDAIRNLGQPNAQPRRTP